MEFKNLINADMKRIVYVDMDNVLVDFKSGIERVDAQTQREYEGHFDDVPHIFSKMKPIDGAIDAFNQLSERYDLYILSTAPWDNPTAWSEKLEWVQKYLGESGYKRLILSHHKNLCHGEIIIDDRTANGVDKFAGRHIHFGSEEFPNWASVLRVLIG
ncbi:MAG: hypothetical protein SNH27_16825 [Rikenellaceae bacterium]